MRCPVCKLETIVVEHAGIELDYCVRCQGLWFDATELDLLFGSMGLTGAPSCLAAAEPIEVTGEPGRKCPICQRLMSKARLGAERGVTIDRCAQGDGLWFDGGELAVVLQQAVNESGTRGKIVSFLGSTFTKPES